MSDEQKAEFLAALMADKNKKSAAWFEAIGLTPKPGSEQVNPDRPDFDAGARESAPVPSDPSRDHNDLVLDLIARTNGGSYE